MSKLFAAKKEQKYLRVMRYGFCLTMILTFGVYLILMIFPGELARFFIESNEPITPDMVKFLQMMFLFQPFVGIYTWLSGIMAKYCYRIIANFCTISFDVFFAPNFADRICFACLFIARCGRGGNSIFADTIFFAIK